MAKAKSNKSLPAGFRDISSIGGDLWKPTKAGSSIQGVMMRVKTVSVERTRNGKKTKEDWNIYTITTKDGDVSIGGSAGTKALAEVKKGKEVFVRYDGSKVMKKGQQPMRLYTIAVK